MTQVFCNGEEVMTTSGTQPKYTVDIWSGNHPFFKGSSSTVVVDEGRVNRFKRRYAGLDTMADMSTMKQGMLRTCSPSMSETLHLLQCAKCGGLLAVAVHGSDCFRRARATTCTQEQIDDPWIHLPTTHKCSSRALQVATTRSI
jgi:ribosomal protein L31